MKAPHCLKNRHSSSVSNNLLYFIKALLQAIDVLKREVQRQREEKEALEANVREQVVSEMMEVISGMQDGFRYVLLTYNKSITRNDLDSKPSSRN